MVKNAAADLGYGWTKALCDGRDWRQPSVLGDARQLFDEQIRPDDVIYDGRLFAGNLAIRHSEMKYAGTKEQKAENWTTEILLRTALGMVAPESVVNLVTGLPIDFYFNQKPAFEKLVGGFRPDRVQLQVGQEKRSICPTINKFKLVPQPLGAAMDYLLDDGGQVARKDEAKKTLLVIDAGYYTLDLLALDGMEIGKASCSPPGLGVDVAYKLLQDYLRFKTSKAPARYELDQHVIAGSYAGYDIRPLVEKAFKALAQQIQLEVESLNLTFSRCLLVGGAAERIYPFLQLQGLIVPADPQAANVRGYRKIAARLWR